MPENEHSQHILCITKSTGGMAVYNQLVATRLHAAGHRVHVICLSDNREQYAHELQKLGLEASSRNMKRYSISLVSDLRVVAHLRRYIRANPVSLIIAHGAKLGFLARLAGRLTGTKVIYVLHSLPFLQRVQGSKAFFYRQAEKLGSRLGGMLVALSNSMYKTIVDNNIAPESQVKVIYTGIDPDALGRRKDHATACRTIGLDPERPIVAWAGRLNRQKAPEDFLKAAVAISESVPEAQFFMAGEGPLAPVVENLASQYKLGTNLIMAPWQKDVSIMLSACTVYVMTSRWEGLPLSLLEAMALECPVVATAVDGIAESIENNISGVLVKPDNPSDVAKQVIALLADDTTRQQLGKNARERVVTAFSIDLMIKRWNDLISDYTSS